MTEGHIFLAHTEVGVYQDVTFQNKGMPSGSLHQQCDLFMLHVMMSVA